MPIAYCSRRLFPDGPLRTPLAENDPANIIYELGGDYLSFLTVEKLSDAALHARLAAYTFVFIALDVRHFATVQRLVRACRALPATRYATYSEGNIADYQMLSPADQYAWVDVLRGAAAVLLYWERYVPFFRTLSGRPTAYISYPFYTDLVARAVGTRQPPRDTRITLPSGLQGHTRNGLAGLLVARALLTENVTDADAVVIDAVEVWVSGTSAAEDARAAHALLTGRPLAAAPADGRGRLLHWLQRARVDYRWLLALRDRLLRSKAAEQRTNAPIFARDRLNVYPRQAWPVYLRQLAQSKLLIDLNSRDTVGRNALDCAALGVPCIASGYSDLQARFFPQTTLDGAWEIDTALTLSRRLLTDRAFYAEVVATATAQLPAYAPAAFRARLSAFCHDYPHVGLPLPPAWSEP